MQPGWYPDPDGIPGHRWFDGQQWTSNFAGVAPVATTAPVPEKPKGRNPLFMVFAVMSLVPTLYFAVAVIASNGSQFFALLTAWSGMWVWVWWKMADRYR